jgi:hypothetical protein
MVITFFIYPDPCNSLLYTFHYMLLRDRPKIPKLKFCHKSSFSYDNAIVFEDYSKELAQTLKFQCVLMLTS